MRAAMLAAIFGCWLLTGSSEASGSAAVLLRVSVDSSNMQGNAASLNGYLDASGRYVAFVSIASNLVPGDTNGHFDIFLRDLQTGQTERVSVGDGEEQSDNDSFTPAVSENGRYIAFASNSTNLVPNDTNGRTDIFVRDRQDGTTVRLSTSTGGSQGDDDSFGANISQDGRFVAFNSRSTNLVSGDTNGVFDVFVRDVQTAQIERVNVASDGTEANAAGLTYRPAMSADGRFVAFDSGATNLASNDTNNANDIFVRDRQDGSTSRISVDSSGTQADGDSGDPSMSSDGQVVAFFSLATNLVTSDTNSVSDLFVHERLTGKTSRASLDSNELEGNSATYGAVSMDGSLVALQSSATNLVPNDTNNKTDVFVRDMLEGTTFRVSVDSAGQQANGNSFGALAVSGQLVGFSSDATNLVPDDTNASTDVFLRDLSPAAVGGVAELPGISLDPKTTLSRPSHGPVDPAAFLSIFGSVATIAGALAVRVKIFRRSKTNSD